ncbi:hypothetical protein [Beijerinckia sp. L45]|uniref:hypothetical protein n=1 Tax=Beijerinckia sp. L45 TaxID=1641855 RepID=UPI00131BF4DC|nr:hypothetical protein [Beijerinckia sp. L45]
MQPQTKTTMQEKPKSFYKKPTLVLLPYKGGQHWYICHGRKKERTAFVAHQKADAKRAVEARSQEVRAPTSINATPIADVVGWARTQPRYKKARFAGIIAVWDGKRVCDLSQHTLDALVLERQTHLHPKTGEPISEKTALTEAGWLKAMSRRHAREHGLPAPGDFAVKRSSPHQNERALTRSETARLLWACLGYRWDAAQLRMVPHDKRTRKRLRRLLAPVRRLLLLGLYAGTSVATGVALVWDATPDGTASYVDVAEGRLLRLGAQAPRTANLRDVPVALGRRMMAHARRWRRQDASDVRHIVHVTTKGKYNRGLADTRFKRICDEAGLPGVTFSMIVTTHAAMALREGASVRALAIALGLSGDAVNRRYKHFSRSFQEGAGKAFRQRPKSIR